MNAGANLSRIVAAFGGVRWEPASKAIELIRTETGCDEDEAIDALCVWVKDERVSTRGLNTGSSLRIHLCVALELANRWHPGSASARSVALDLYKVDMNALRDLLARPGLLRPGRSSQTSKRPAGRPPIYAWAQVEPALEEKCRSQGSVPRAEHLDRKWRKLADACRYVRDQFAIEWRDGGPSESVLKQNVGSMLERIKKAHGRKLVTGDSRPLPDDPLLASLAHSPASDAIQPDAGENKR